MFSLFMYTVVSLSSSSAITKCPPREKAEAQHQSEDLSNCTWLYIRANKSYGLFMLGHTDVLVFFRSWSQKSRRTSCLRMATMIVDRANHCCASLPCLTTQCLSVSLSVDNEEVEAQPLDVVLSADGSFSRCAKQNCVVRGFPF